MKRLNIILSTIDAWRYDAFGSAPDQHWLKRYDLDSKLNTPHLDDLVSHGIYFTQALSTAPHTTVSHASIMTGLFPPQHGVHSFLYETLPVEIITLAEHLKKMGYLTIALREAENTQEPGLLERVNILRGFDLVIHDLDQLIRISKENNSKPVFAFLHLWDLHAPYLYSNWARQKGFLADNTQKIGELSARWKLRKPEPAEITERKAMEFQKKLAEKIAKSEERIRVLFEWYLDGVNWFDRIRMPYLLDVLKEANLWEDTVHVFYGDHGEGIHPEGIGNRVFEHGQSLLDDVLRVPLFLHGIPGLQPSVIQSQVSLVDIFPTVLELAGISNTSDLFKDAAFHGESLLQNLQDLAENQERPHFAELSLGGPDFNLAHPSPQCNYQRCIRTSRHKVICHYPPFLMKRYQKRDEIFRKALHRTQKFANQLKISGSDEGGQKSPSNPPRFFWTDLIRDADETQPVLLKDETPEEITSLMEKLSQIYRDQRAGPAIEIEKFNQSILFQRLADLGYIDPE